MLYITTKDNRDAYTAHRALTADCAPDGGRFVPFRLPCYDAEEISALKEKAFGQTVAEILNMFFSCRLTGWDVDFHIGRNVTKLSPMNHRLAVAELWHNPSSKYSFIVDSLFRVISADTGKDTAPSDWAKIAVQIAVLFGLYGDMLRSGLTERGETFDISVSADDFAAPMAAWYARGMGLPIGTIICTCEDNSSVWDLIHRGTFNTAAAHPTLILGIERLIQATLGFDHVCVYREKCGNRQIYTVDEAALEVLNFGVFCAVAGENRSGAIINSVFRSNSYLIDPLTALCYGGVQDYRARTGGSRLTLLLAENSPMDYVGEIASATGIPGDRIVEHVKFS